MSSHARQRSIGSSVFAAALAAALVMALSSPAAAQGVQTGTIRGVVRDTQGLGMPGVTATVTSTALQTPRSAVTSGDGAYTFATLPLVTTSFASSCQVSRPSSSGPASRWGWSWSRTSC